MADENRAGPTTGEKPEAPSAPPPKPTTPEEARAILDAHREAKAKACWDAVREVLKARDCSIRAQPYIDDDGAVKASFFVYPL